MQTSFFKAGRDVFKVLVWVILYFDTVQSSPKYNDYLIYGLGLNNNS